MSAADQIADADTVVLMHGLRMTPRSWEHWIPRFEHRGYRVLAPAYPGLEAVVDHDAFGVSWNNPLPSGEPALSLKVAIVADLQLARQA